MGKTTPSIAPCTQYITRLFFPKYSSILLELIILLMPRINNEPENDIIIKGTSIDAFTLSNF